MVNWTDIKMEVTFNKEQNLSQAQRQTRWEIYKNLRQQYENTFDDDFIDADVFNVIKPQPENDNSRLWRLNNWGTAWELNDTHLEFYPDLDGRFIIMGQVGNYLPQRLIDYMESIGFYVKTQFVGRPLYRNSQVSPVAGRLVWGEWETGFGRGYTVVTVLHEAMLNDEEITQEWNENLRGLEGDGMFRAIMALTLWGDFDYYEADIDLESYEAVSFLREALDEQLTHNLQLIQRYLNQNNTQEVEKARALRIEYLEKVEILMEEQKISEGKYLEYCNILRDINIEEQNAISQLNDLGSNLENEV